MPKCDHEWRHAGACQCPNEKRDGRVPGYFCSRTVNECVKCGASDFGDSAEAEKECKRCPERAQ